MRGYVDKLFGEVSIHCPVRTDAGSMVLKVATVETAWEGRSGVECEFLGLVLFAHTRAEQHGRSGFYGATISHARVGACVVNTMQVV